MDVMGRLKRALGATRAHLGDRLDGAVGGITPEILEEALIAADAGVDLAAELARELREVVRGGKVKPGGEKAWLTERLTKLLAFEGSPAKGNPHVVLTVGVNGSGKTTTAAKLAARLRAENGPVMLVAADTFRAAAIEQLQLWGERLGIPVIAHRPGADPGAVVHDALQAAKSRSVGAVIVDTAGRLHTKHNLMAELEKVNRVCGRAVSGAPHEVLLVLDATTGGNGIAQAREFRARAGVTGVVLSKLDGTARGGVALAVASELQIPVRWVTIGEDVDDLLPFDARRFVDGLLGEA